MIERTKTTLFAFLFLTCIVVKANPASSIPPDKPGLLRYTDEPSTALSLQPLRDVAMDDSDKEVRIWLWFGAKTPQKMVRFQVGPNGSVEGYSYLYYRLSIKSNNDPDDRKFYQSIIAECKVIGESAKFEACQKKDVDSALIARTYTALKDANLWQLSDQSDVPKEKGQIEVLDGVSMVVELRNGKQYRAYEWSNPGFRTGSEAAKASNMMRILKGF